MLALVDAHRLIYALTVWMAILDFHPGPMRSLRGNRFGLSPIYLIGRAENKTLSCTFQPGILEQDERSVRIYRKIGIGVVRGPIMRWLGSSVDYHGDIRSVRSAHP